VRFTDLRNARRVFRSSESALNLTRLKWSAYFATERVLVFC
jgi:hypothetical protein